MTKHVKISISVHEGTYDSALDEREFRIALAKHLETKADLREAFARACSFLTPEIEVLTDLLEREKGE